MSAAPRPWVFCDPRLVTFDLARKFEDCIGLAERDLPGSCVAIIRYGADANTVLRSVNAFDALLAVAKGVAAVDTEALRSAMRTLDAAHPDWREWIP